MYFSVTRMNIFLPNAIYLIVFLFLVLGEKYSQTTNELLVDLTKTIEI